MTQLIGRTALVTGEPMEFGHAIVACFVAEDERVAVVDREEPSEFDGSVTEKTLMVGIASYQSRYGLDVPAIMSGLTLATLPIVALHLFGQRFFVRGLVSGAVKGEQWRVA